MGEILDRTILYARTKINSALGRTPARLSLDRIAQDQATLSALRQAGALNDHQEAALSSVVKQHIVSDPKIDVDALTRLGSKNIKALQETIKKTEGDKSLDADWAALDYAYRLAQEAEAQVRLSQGSRVSRRAVVLGFGGAAGAGLLALLYTNLPQAEQKVAVVSTLRPTAIPTPIPPAPTATSVPTVIPTRVPPTRTASPAPTATLTPEPTLTPTPTPEIKPTREPTDIERLAKEILGPDFLGEPAIRLMEDRARRIGNNISFNLNPFPTIQYNLRDLELAKEDGEMLVLRANEFKDGGKSYRVSLVNLLAIFKDANKDSKILLIAHNYPWPNGDPLVTGEEEMNLGWSLVKKDPMDGSQFKTWAQQEVLLKQYGGALSKRGASKTIIGRRTVTEVVWDSVSYFISNNDKLLQNKYDRPRTQMSNGSYLEVGNSSSGSPWMSIWQAGEGIEEAGVCPSR